MVGMPDFMVPEAPYIAGKQAGYSSSSRLGSVGFYGFLYSALNGLTMGVGSL